MPFKKTRPLLALCLCLTLLFLPACGGRQGSEVPLNSLPSLAAEPPAPPAEPNNAVSNTVSYFPSELDPTQAPTLTWAVLQGVRLTEETAVELNRRLSELGCGYQVQFAVFEDFQKPAGKTMREALEEALGTSPDLITCGTRTYQRPSDPSRPLSEQPHAGELVYEDVKGELREENSSYPWTTTCKPRPARGSLLKSYGIRIGCPPVSRGGSTGSRPPALRYTSAPLRFRHMCWKNWGFPRRNSPKR